MAINEGHGITHRKGSIATALIGVWRLQHYSQIAEGLPAQYPFGLNPEGLLIYTPNGFMSALLMTPDRPELSGNGFMEGTPAEYTAAAEGFIGYSGIFEVDEFLSIVTHRPLVAFASNMIGSRQRRLIELEEDILTLTTEDVQLGGSPSTKSLLKWVRVKAGPEAEAQ